MFIGRRALPDGPGNAGEIRFPEQLEPGSKPVWSAHCLTRRSGSGVVRRAATDYTE